jgi:hypothetical protein
MRIRIAILLAFALLMVGAASITSTPPSRELVESVATFVCPAKNGDSSGVIYLGNKGGKSALVDKKNRQLKGGNERSLQISDRSRVVAGDSATPILLASKSSEWIGLTQCTASSGEFWFVGGAADVSSLGYFQFTNENLGKAIIDIEMWSEDGSESTRTLTIPPRSTKNYSLTTFLPGKKRTAFHLVSRSGLVSATLFDQRRQGLTLFGGDFVSASTAPSTEVIMVGIPGPKFVKQSKLSSQKIRLFVPGETDAIVQVTYISPSGVFAPIGLDSIRVPAQKVVEVDLSGLPTERLFSLRLKATEPLIGSTITRGTFANQRELLWSNSTQPTQGEQIVLPERTGYLSILSEAPKVRFTAIGAGGKRSNITLDVDSMAIWKVPNTVRAIQLSTGAKPIYLAFTMQSVSGVATTSLASAQSKERTALPVVDSSLYIPLLR